MNSLNGETGDRIDVECEAGYAGGGVVVCNDDGSWSDESGERVVCVPEACNSMSVENSPTFLHAEMTIAAA